MTPRDRAPAAAPGARGLTEDAFLGGVVMVLQPASGYRAGLDAVLLAAAAPVRAGRAERVADLGAGVGVVGLCVAARLPAAEVVLVEREPVLAAIARENVARNGMAGRVTVVAATIGARPARPTAAGLAPDSVDHCLANPPYSVEGRGRASTDPLKAGSHAMPAGGLEAWARLMARITRPGGTATVIHRADALQELLAVLSPRFGALSVLPVHAKAGEPAIRVLVCGIKASRAPLVLKAGLVLHGPGGSYRREIEAVLRTPSALPTRL